MHPEKTTTVPLKPVPSQPTDPWQSTLRVIAVFAGPVMFYSAIAMQWRLVGGTGWSLDANNRYRDFAENLAITGSILGSLAFFFVLLYGGNIARLVAALPGLVSLQMLWRMIQNL